MCMGIVRTWMRWCPHMQVISNYSALRLPAGQGFTYLGTYPGTYPTRANIPAQDWCTTLITGTILEGLGYWKVPWYWYWSLSERTNQASMTLGNTNPLLLVLLVLLVLGRDMRWYQPPYQYQPGNLDKSSALLSLKFVMSRSSGDDHP